MPALRGSERKYLRGLAQKMHPVVHIGKGGITDGVVSAVNAALDQHELVKVRFQEFKEEKKALSAQLSERTASEQVGMVGHVSIFYREQGDPEKRIIQMP